MLRDDPVWLIDEFCADLDPVAASIVAHNLRKIAIREGRIAFLAAANHAHFLKALRPTQVLVVRAGDWPEYLSHRYYTENYGEQRYA
jgi:ABC-type ATPase with predicted acetyltransferase domain